ncbi:hypothetical protein [Nocardia flavorosea]|uniref:hypothetical protein n=1 Tax=Nocardia flavorosea TaxID=53429 RepID=UPI0007A49D1C
MLGVDSTFAGYRIEGILGRGGMGTVYLARHPRLPRSVALKLLNREVSTDPELSRRFEREADVVARLEHPGVADRNGRGMLVATPHDTQAAHRTFAPHDPGSVPNVYPAVGAAGKWSGPPPPKGTAVTAGVLTLILGLLFVAGFVGGLVNTVTGTTSGPVSIVVLIIFLLLMVLWNGAAILLLSGRHAGRILTAICWGVGTVAAVVALFVTRSEAGSGLFLCLLMLCAVALTSAAGGATKRWVEYRTCIRAEKYR